MKGIQLHVYLGIRYTLLDLIKKNRVHRSITILHFLEKQLPIELILCIFSLEGKNTKNHFSQQEDVFQVGQS